MLHEVAPTAPISVQKGGAGGRGAALLETGNQLLQPARLERLDVVVEEEQQVEGGALGSVVVGIREGKVLPVLQHGDRKWQLLGTDHLHGAVARSVVGEDQLKAGILGGRGESGQQQAQVRFPVAVNHDDRDGWPLVELGHGAQLAAKPCRYRRTPGGCRRAAGRLAAHAFSTLTSPSSCSRPSAASSELRREPRRNVRTRKARARA